MKVYIIVDNYCTRCTESIYGVFPTQEGAEKWLQNSFLSSEDKEYMHIVEEEIIYD